MLGCKFWQQSTCNAVSYTESLCYCHFCIEITSPPRYIYERTWHRINAEGRGYVNMPKGGPLELDNLEYIDIIYVLHIYVSYPFIHKLAKKGSGCSRPILKHLNIRALYIYICNRILKSTYYWIQTYDLGGIPVWKASEESKGFQPHRDQWKPSYSQYDEMDLNKSHIDVKAIPVHHTAVSGQQ